MRSSKDLSKFDHKYSLFFKNETQKETLQNNASTLQLTSNIQNYWQRVFSASMKVAEHIFNTPDNQYPLQYQNKKPNAIDDNENTQGKKKWITATDIDYLILMMIYALLRMAWEKNVLVLGLIKDTAAADMIKTVLPILLYSGNLRFSRELPIFNSDKMLLQTASIINADFSSAPWRTFEYDTCLKTVAPLNSNSHVNEKHKKHKKESGNERPKVAGAHKNLISGEKLFLKSYIQLWGSKTDPYN